MLTSFLIGDYYVGHVVSAAKPRFLIVIGKAVGRTLNERLRATMGGNYLILPQPQAHLSSAGQSQVHETYYDTCQRHCQ